MKDKGSLPLESYALDHALLLWVRKLICFPILVCPEPVLGKHDRFHSTQNTALFSSLFSSCMHNTQGYVDAAAEHIEWFLLRSIWVQNG